MFSKTYDAMSGGCPERCPDKTKNGCPERCPEETQAPPPPKAQPGTNRGAPSGPAIQPQPTLKGFSPMPPQGSDFKGKPGNDARISVYGRDNPPAAADFRKGATTRAEIEQACSRRRELSIEQGNARGARVRKD
jgi:hypothetical protein